MHGFIKFATLYQNVHMVCQILSDNTRLYIFFVDGVFMLFIHFHVGCDVFGGTGWDEVVLSRFKDSGCGGWAGLSAVPTSNL